MTHKHTYDEYGLCFECDKQKPASRPDDQARYRARQAAAGKVQYNRLVTEKEKKALDDLLSQLRKIMK
jgi:hypothetical protein